MIRVFACACVYAMLVMVHERCVERAHACVCVNEEMDASKPV